MNGNFTWILDNGHGIDTPGKHSLRLPDGRQLLEYRLSREVVNDLEISLKSLNLSIHRLVPEPEDISPPSLPNRTSIPTGRTWSACSIPPGAC